MRYAYQRANCQNPLCKPGACILGWEVVDTDDGMILEVVRSASEAQRIAAKMNAAKE